MENEKKLKVFITDDDIFSLNVHEQYLKNIGISDINLFLNGVECLNNLSLNPDIIFIDHNMDILNGFETLKKIKRVNPNIFVVMVSAQENMNTAIEALKYGAFDYIIKGEEVESKMRSAIHRISLIQEEVNKANPGILKKILSFI